MAVKQFFKNLSTNLGVVGEFFGFLWERKLWWLIPMVTVLVLFGILLVVAQVSAISPFIYTLY